MPPQCVVRAETRTSTVSSRGTSWRHASCELRLSTLSACGGKAVDLGEGLAHGTQHQGPTTAAAAAAAAA
eukprot:CAMPEP_0174723624 /NCGR_PEP_ID=MMETSP1094-20130205/41457_1 /TAXON_ID=156173 /ORGANISM="Chrysochromulina brevifilum, Strain UTEX LB 985" /LENGTH=69 /DNA_ID=CAMNT_0015924701 /DNA_START=77 /DNA_END=284 /DNA_ORIENTATION=-